MQSQGAPKLQELTLKIRMCLPCMEGTFGKKWSHFLTKGVVTHLGRRERDNRFGETGRGGSVEKRERAKTCLWSFQAPLLPFTHESRLDSHSTASRKHTSHVDRRAAIEESSFSRANEHTIAVIYYARRAEVNQEAWRIICWCSRTATNLPYVLHKLRYANSG